MPQGQVTGLGLGLACEPGRASEGPPGLKGGEKFLPCLTVLGAAGCHLASCMERDHIWDEARQTYTEPRDSARGQPWAHTRSPRSSNV